MDGQGNELVDGQAVQRDVLIAFEYAHNEDDWVFPLADALVHYDLWMDLLTIFHFHRTGKRI